MAYLCLLRWVLAGVLIEGSHGTDGVYVWALRMPLYAPTGVIDPSWSERIGSGTTVWRRRTASG